MTVFLVLQQVIVASSSIFLVQFIELLQSEGDWKFYLILLLVSVVTPYIPGSLAIYLNQKWINESFKRLWKTSLQTKQGHIGDVFNISKKSKYSTQVKEIGNIIEDTCKFFLGYFPQILNFLFNGFVMSKILGYNFFIAFLLGLAISSIQFLFILKVGKRLSEEKQESIGHIDVHFNSGWQTLLIGNKPYKNNLLKSFESAEDSYILKSLKLSRFEVISSVSVFMFSFLPTLTVILITAFSNSATKETMISLGALLPRIFQIFVVFSNVLIGAQQVFAFKGRWKSVLNRFNEILSENPIQERIKFDMLNIVRISTNGNQMENEKIEIENFLELNSENKILPSRWHLTGRNGAGKSSWMLKFKNETGERSVYLPAFFEEFHLDNEKLNMSTGQKKIFELQRLLTNIDLYDFIFLDEWDANLDYEARKQGNALIDQLALTAIVIESRHTHTQVSN